MGMSIDSLCNSCTNIGCEFQSGIVRTKCDFYMPPHIESDNCGNYVVMQPTVEVIPKADYEARLKSDMVAMLTEIQLEIEEKSYCDTTIIGNYEDEVRIDLVELDDVNEVIQLKINSLKAESEPQESEDQDG